MHKLNDLDLDKILNYKQDWKQYPIESYIQMRKLSLNIPDGITDDGNR